MNGTATVDIDALHRKLVGSLGDVYLERVQMRILRPSGLSVRVDGANCLSSIGVWPNGCCDAELLHASSEQAKFEHFEFKSTDDAYEAAFREIERALARA